MEFIPLSGGSCADGSLTAQLQRPDLYYRNRRSRAARNYDQIRAAINWNGMQHRSVLTKEAYLTLFVRLNEGGGGNW